MKVFSVIRNKDFSGVSGTGKVLNGVIFPNGVTVVQWCKVVPSVGIYPSFDDFLSVHVTSHPTNETEILWSLDEED